MAPNMAIGANTMALNSTNRCRSATGRTHRAQRCLGLRSGAIGSQGSFSSNSEFPQKINKPRSSVAASAAAPVEAPGTESLECCTESSEDLPRFVGVIPQMNAVPRGTVDYSLTGWKGPTAVGVGFERETSQYRAQAIDFDAVEPNEPVLFLTERMKVITTASEFAEAMTVGVSLSLEAWIVEIDVSVEVSKNTEFASNGVTSSLLRTYKSEPVYIVDPAQKRVNLNNTAKKILREQGPKAFHEIYGTHFVAGYTFGGLFNGYFQTRFESSEQSESQKASVSASVSAFGLASAKVSGSVSIDIQTKTSSSSTRAAYSTYGWNADKDVNGEDISIPPTVTDLRTLFDAANLMEIDSGRKLEAVVTSYSDLPDYGDELAAYEANQPTSFSLLAQLLNTEFLQLEFLERVTDDLILTIRPDETSKSAVDRFNLLVKCVRGIQRDIFQQKSKITRQFGSDDDARDNWFALDAYVTQQRRLKLLQLSGDPSNTIFADFDDTGNAELEKKGEEKACDVFMSKKLEERYNEQLSKAQGQWPENPA